MRAHTSADILVSTIIPAFNCEQFVAEAIQSALEQKCPNHEIIVVNDCGGPIWLEPRDELTNVVTNRFRCGVGPSRDVGAASAQFEWLLLTDSHMRFTPGWWEAAKKRLSPSPTHVIHCATCLQLDKNHMDVANPAGEYNGATYNWLGPDRNDPSAPEQILECVWLPKDQTPEDGDEIPAVMGACYFISRSWYYKISPLRLLRSWGGDELMLSMKTWLAGGSIRMARTIRIGHRFLAKGERKPFSNPMGHVLWNKVMAAWTLFPPEIAERLEKRILETGRKEELRDREACRAMVRNDWHLIASEIQRNEFLFVFDAEWMADKFGLALPR